MVEEVLKQAKKLLLKKDDPSINPAALWVDDKLQREKFGDRLTQIISTIDQPFTIGLQAPYGSGKTFFFNRWHQTLLDQGYSAVIFDAWKTDFSKDPLVAFISAFREQLPKLHGGISQKSKEKVTILGKKLASAVRTKAIPILARAALEKAIGAANADDLIKDFKVGEVGEALLEKVLEEQQEAERSIEVFKKELGDLIAELEGAGSEQPKRKLVVLVDELDRCRPDYAVSLLECIKHFFSVRGVIFILAIDDRQLKAAIRSVYGEIDASGYLARFIDAKLRLPLPSHRNFAEAQWEHFDLEGLQNIDRESFVDEFATFSQVYDLTLRQQGQLFTKMNLVLRLYPGMNTAWTLPIVSILRDYDEELTEKVLKLEKFDFTIFRSLGERYSSAFRDAQAWGRVLPKLLGMTISEEMAEILQQKQANEVIEGCYGYYKDFARGMRMKGVSVFQHISKMLDEAEQLIGL